MYIQWRKKYPLRKSLVFNYTQSYPHYQQPGILIINCRIKHFRRIICHNLKQLVDAWSLNKKMSSEKRNGMSFVVYDNKINL